jgi:S1-C subfamily serine protease
VALRKKHLLFLLPLVLTVLACNGQELFLAPAPTSLPAGVTSSAEAEDTLLINIYKQANPAVVYIRVLIKDEDSLVLLGAGSGFVIDTKGHIVTNNHVIETADAVMVTFSDGSVTDAQVLGRDSYSDLAVLKVDRLPEGAKPLELGDSSKLQVGQRVIAIGNPFGLEGTMTTGIVSAVGRSLSAEQTGVGVFSIPEIIQTDAAINPGNSGGPLLDSQGQVVGVNTAIRSLTGTNSGVGFAIPVNIVKRIVPKLIEEGTYHYPYLGISSDNRLPLADLAGPLGLPVTRGVLITSVVEGTAADRAGLRGGDPADTVEV